MGEPSDRTAPAYRYDAFISYRHVEPDRAWAKWLHRALETWRTPKLLVAKGVRPRLAPVFRDEDELPASADLSSEIDKALEQSRFLIVVCSPRTPESKWVNQEIVRFREMGRSERILALLVEGEPSGSFPPALRTIRRRITEGAATKEAIEEVEPLAADVRASRDEKPALLKRMARLRLLACVLGCRFDDLRRREQERHRRRMLVATGVMAGVVLLLAALSLFAFQQKGLADDRALAVQRALDKEARALREVEKERDARGKALDEVLRLADVKTVRDLVTEADTLWPIHPDRAPAMADWLARAKEAVGNRSFHEASLARLKEHPESFGSERTTAWRLQVLTDLVAGLDALQDPKDATKGLVAMTAARHQESITLRVRSIDDHEQEWTQTIQAVAASPKYGGLSIPPQLGLVPLGPDPDSELLEFAHLGSGSIPERDPATKRLVYAEDAAIVLVLIPGGTFKMGAQKADEKQPNYDPQAEDDEGPVHEETLSPFLLAKHECTQAQWAAMCGGWRPSTYMPGGTVGGQAVTDRNPVERISWEDCAGVPGWLTRNRLRLPTEPQWEYACRAATDTPWSTGREPVTLGGGANIADKCCKTQGGPAAWTYTEEVDDEYVSHAPVGTFKPNGFGLFDVHGNVWEWCGERFEKYGQIPENDQMRDGSGFRPIRGGSWIHAADGARSSNRYGVDPGYRDDGLGVRPARGLDQ